jgi:putative PIN family toxin of toxin-antitoxin system
LRVVIDTNVLVAAVINRGGRPSQSIELVARRGTLVLTHGLVHELREVLSRPYFASRIDVRRRAAIPVALARIAHFVVPTETIRICRDPKDDKFLEAAVAGNAAFIVTGDADLLALDPFRGIRIVNPAAFLALHAPPAG